MESAAKNDDFDKAQECSRQLFSLQLDSVKADPPFEWFGVCVSYRSVVVSCLMKGGSGAGRQYGLLPGLHGPRP